MSYQVRFTETTNALKPAITVDDQTLDNTTSVTFVGKNYAGYAQVIAENFLHLLENFAKNTAPSSPIQGQLWFDNTSGVNLLKVWDGTTWATTGGVKKSSTQPINAIVGDLWADTDNQQLYLYNGAQWILVGPNYSEGLKTGPDVETFAALVGDVSYPVITFWSNGDRMAIISKATFTPKATITGFSEIKEGFNLSTVNATSTTTPSKFWGTAEKANALVINNISIPGTSFLRSDQTSTTSYAINIRNNTGVSVGSDLSFSLGTDAGRAVLYNKITGSSIDFKVVDNSGATRTVLVVDSTSRVGINNTAPEESLDVSGNIKTDGNLLITGTQEATSLSIASIVTAGGISVAKKIKGGSDLDLAGTINLSKSSGAVMLPATTGTLNIGSEAKRFSNVYADNFGSVAAPANFYGSFSGTLSASAVAGQAVKLQFPVLFSLSGDVISSDSGTSFNGQGGVAVLNNTINPSFITNKSLVTDSYSSDEILINRPGTGLRRTTKSAIVNNIATIPIGGIIPYAGNIAPSGFLLCDGSEVSQSLYSELFSVIGYNYRDVSLLLGFSTFALPDLRGRFALGRDNMDNGNTMISKESGLTNTPITIDAGGGSANRVTDTAADLLGAGSGSESFTLNVNNLPDHKHNLRGVMPDGDRGNQYYAFRNVAGSPPDRNASSGFGATAPAGGQYLLDSGGIDVPLGTQLATPVTSINPYLTINYIIYTGVLA